MFSFTNSLCFSVFLVLKVFFSASCIWKFYSSLIYHKGIPDYRFYSEFCAGWSTVVLFKNTNSNNPGDCLVQDLFWRGIFGGCFCCNVYYFQTWFPNIGRAVNALVGLSTNLGILKKASEVLDKFLLFAVL